MGSLRGRRGPHIGVAAMAGLCALPGAEPSCSTPAGSKGNGDPIAPSAAHPLKVTGRYSADMVCPNRHRWRAEVVSTLNDTAPRMTPAATRGIQSKLFGALGALWRDTCSSYRPTRAIDTRANRQWH